MPHGKRGKESNLYLFLRVPLIVIRRGLKSVLIQYSCKNNYTTRTLGVNKILFMENKSKEDIKLLKSYYIKRLAEILDEEFNEEQANFEVYSSDDYEFDPYGHIIANKMGLEKIGVELLKTAQSIDINKNDTVDFYSMNKWISGEILFGDITVGDKKTKTDETVRESKPINFISNMLFLIIPAFIILSLIIGAIQIIGWVLKIII